VAQLEGVAVVRWSRWGGRKVQGAPPGDASFRVLSANPVVTRRNAPPSENGPVAPPDASLEIVCQQAGRTVGRARTLERETCGVKYCGGTNLIFKKSKNPGSGKTNVGQPSRTIQARAIAGTGAQDLVSEPTINRHFLLPSPSPAGEIVLGAARLAGAWSGGLRRAGDPPAGRQRYPERKSPPGKAGARGPRRLSRRILGEDVVLGFDDGVAGESALGVVCLGRLVGGVCDPE